MRESSRPPGHSAGPAWSPASLLVLAICWITIVSDGYDVVVFGAVVPSLLREPDWGLDPAGVGLIGSFALIGMFIGSLTVGTLTDRFGRRRMLIACLAWFSATTGLCALAPSPEVFGLLRFLAGLGLGGVLPTATALTGEFSHPRTRNLVYAIMFSGFPLGGIGAAMAGIFLIPRFGWQSMFLLGLLPLFVVLPLALRYLPESPAFLLAKGRRAEAEELASRWGVPLEPAGERLPAPGAPVTASPVRSLFRAPYLAATLCFLPAAFLCLFMIYGMNTWLPEIMRQAGHSAGSALSFLLVFNLGAVLGTLAVSLVADRLGSKPVIVATFLLAGVAVVLLSLRLPDAPLYAAVALGGVGTIGTQTFITAYVFQRYPVRMGATALGWTLGFGRLGSVLAPPVLGLIMASGLAVEWNFYTLAVPAVLGAVLIALIRPTSPAPVPAPARHSARPATDPA